VTAVDWFNWAWRFPLEVRLIPAQNDEAILKPEVVHLERRGVYLQATRDELEAALATLPARPKRVGMRITSIFRGRSKR
jgi:hypothetical protein